MARREFSRSVKVAAVKRATVDGKLFCEGCGGLVKGKFEIDHIRADGLLGEPTLENARVLCQPCHKEKTKADVGAISKAKRVEARHLGIQRKVRRIQSRSFPLVEKQQRIIKGRLPPRGLYTESNDV
jgi:5-methylcytosine-specific restriction endonuclease McrA